MNQEFTKYSAHIATWPAWKRFLVKGLLLCFAVMTCTVARASVLANTQQDEVKPDYASHPQAKSEQERVDFNSAYAMTAANSAETAASNFAVKYPDSQLRRYLYTNAMLLYQKENNSAKMLAMGDKVLELDSENPLALVLTATALADGLGDRDRDRDKKINTIKHNANKAIQAAEAGYGGSSSSAAQVYKTTLQSMAYSALGIMKLKIGDDAGAEKDLTTASMLTKIHPDPYVWYHLALAQDHRRKYVAALSSVNQALQLSSSNPELQKLAEVEQQRLTGLAKVVRQKEAEEPQ